MRIQVTFKGGAQIEADVEEFETAPSALDGALNRINWTTPGNWTRKLHTIELSEVAAIVAIEDGAA